MLNTNMVKLLIGLMMNINNIMPKIRKIKVSDRKDSRGGGYSRRKFTVAEADAIRLEFNTSESKITISAMARKYEVSQPLMYQLLKGTTYTDK